MISITSDQVRKALKMQECINSMEAMFKEEADTIKSSPLRTAIFADPSSLFLTMPAYSNSLKKFVVKIITEFKNNPAKYSLPAQGGLILLMDGNDSRVLAMLDAHSVTRIRTGAVSGLATKYLSRTNSRLVAVLGSGQEATTLLEAICQVRRIEQARVYSRHPENAKKFADKNSKELGIEVSPSSSSSEALFDADIAILATNSSEPVASWNEIPSGCHINSIGTLPNRREVDLETVCRSKLFVDTRDGVLKEAGDIMHAISSGRIGADHISADLSELVLGRCSGRDSDEQVTLFKSVGFALQDVYASNFVYEKVKHSR